MVSVLTFPNSKFYVSASGGYLPPLQWIIVNYLEENDNAIKINCY